MPRRDDIRGWDVRPIPGNPKVSLAVAAYMRTDPLACLLYSLRSQTYDNWEAVIVHDGPGPEARSVVEKVNDPRIVFLETPTRLNQYGHPNRSFAASRCTGDYVGMSNDDNYYAPAYFEAMLRALTSTGADFAHCDMVHSHYMWTHFVTQPRKYRCDLACWVAKAELVKSTPWRDMNFAGDGTFVDDMVAKCGPRKTIHVPMTLLCHN